METGIGSFIRMRRAELGLNQTELATRAEMTRAHLAVIESGKVNLPNADLRRRIARALEVSHLDLLVAAGEITREEISPLMVQGTVYVESERAALLDRLRRVQLRRDRVETLEAILDRWLQFDRKAADGIEERASGRNTDALDDERHAPVNHPR